MNIENMRHFNLQDALSGKAVILRNGKKAYIRHHETEIAVYNGLQLQGVTECGALRAWNMQGLILDYATGWDIVGMCP